MIDKKLTFSEWMKAIGMFLITIPLELSSFVVVPIALLFVKKGETLPNWLMWYEEINWPFGDRGWIKDHFPEPENRSWWGRVRWLLRNRINGYQISVQGFDVDKIQMGTFNVLGNPNATDNDTSNDTFCLIRVKDSDNKKYFSFYCEKQWCKFFYIRMYIGWKLMDISTVKNRDDVDKWIESRKLEGKMTVLESVFSINPFKRRRK